MSIAYLAAAGFRSSARCSECLESTSTVKEVRPDGDYRAET